MAHFTVDQVKAMLKEVPDKKLNEAVIKGVLKLSDEEIDTLMFVFGLCYLAERDMEAVLTEPWKKLEQMFPPETVNRAKEILNDFLSREKEGEPTLDDVLTGLDVAKAEEIKVVVEARYRPKRILKIEDLSTFGEKIRAYTTIFSKNNVAEVLWVLKELRDNLSHGRIKDLEYQGVSLMKREAKEKILSDYLTSVDNPDHGKSRLNDELKLSPDESEDIQRLFKSIS